MNYEEALNYIHAVQWAGHKPGLTRTRTLLAALGNPHKQLKFIHVAGTNGKGSTAAMLASCLQAAGYRVGLFTSPFINRFNERIQVDGQQIPDEELVQLVERVQPAADAMTGVQLLRTPLLWAAGCTVLLVRSPGLQLVLPGIPAAQATALAAVLMEGNV